MSKYHGEQFWSEIRHQTLQGWRDVTDDDFATLRTIRHDREVHIRAQRACERRDRQMQRSDTEL